jgi:beta-glucosidase
MSVTFPDGFAWGTATASYQIEGAVDEDGRSKSIWDTFSHTPGKIQDGENGDVASDHYHRFHEDAALMAQLGAGWYRFSLAWPRIQPSGSGGLNEKGVDFYSRLIDALLENNVRPWVTIYHWDLPQALQDAGGWPERDTAYRFAEYAAAIHERLRDRVQHWTTLNEPYCSAFLGYSRGVHAPGIQDGVQGLRAAHHLLLGHGLAVEAMRANGPEDQYGITLNLHPPIAASDSEADQDAARRVDAVSNRVFLDPLFKGAYPEDLRSDVASITDMGYVQGGDEAQINQPLDFLGINYYFRPIVQANAGDPSQPTEWPGSGDVRQTDRGWPKTEMGWEIDPDGLHAIITRVAREYPGVPLYVTENGMACPDVVADDGGVHDQARIDYLDAHFRAAHRAIEDGVDLRGYFVWTTIDNFEWAFGFTKRFGLIYVDYETLERIPKDSARWFAQVTKANGLTD